MPGTPESPLPSGTLTFVFTDIEGSTDLLRSLGPDYPKALATHAQILRDAISAHGGTEVSTEGDGFFAVFPTAVGALAACVRSQQELAAVEWPAGAMVRVRMGMHTGTAVLGGDNYAGIDVNLAARISAAGHGGQVLLSEAARIGAGDELPSGVSVRALGEYRLKGLPDPVPIHRLVIDGLPDIAAPLSATRRGNIPKPLTSLIGREEEISAVELLVREHRWVTLVGTGGIGKTRLAIEVARRLDDTMPAGAHFVDLSSLRDAALVPTGIARALEVGVGPSDDAAAAVGEHLRLRELLLVLDNVEQVADTVGFVDRLMADAPRLRVLVTSRMALGAYGEQVYDVPPLDLPDDAAEAADSAAVQLFVERARARHPGFEPSTDDLEALGEISARLDGLPLAIELAAVQLRLLSPKAILERLEAHRPLPSPAIQGLPRRQQTLEDTIAWSHDLLDADERRVFARLAVLPGGADLAAAEAVASDTDSRRHLVELLDGLMAKSLLVRRDEGNEVRFGMLETVRHFAEERLRESPDGDRVAQQAAEYLMARAAEAEQGMRTAEASIWLDRCAREMPNIRRALAWCREAGEVAIGLELASSLERYWRVRGPLWEGRRAIEALLQSAPDGPRDRVRVRALVAVTSLAWWDGDPEAGHRSSQEAYEIARGLDEPDAKGAATYELGLVTMWRSHLDATAPAGIDRAEALFREALDLARRAGDSRAEGRALRGIGTVTALMRRDLATALPLLERSVDVLAGIGDPWELNESLVVLGNIHRFGGQPDRAAARYLEAIGRMEAAGNRQVVSTEVLLVAALASDLGDHARAVRIVAGSEAAERRYGGLRPPGRHALMGDPVGAARTAIGDDAVEREMATGRAMDLAELVADIREGFLGETSPSRRPAPVDQMRAGPTSSTTR